nr:MULTISPECIES: RHS repeat-associated core domain-containing protein [unclassified Treponema]
MKTKYYIYSQPNHLTSRVVIAREQKQFIKIAFAVHLSAVISAERYRSDSEALKSAVPALVYFYIIMIVHKCQQSAAQSCLGTFELRVLPFGKTSGGKLLNLLSNSTDRTFENRRSRYKELGKKVPQAYRVYVEDTFLPCDAGDARIFSKEETGLYYYGARYLDPKYSRWLSGDPALNDYIPQAPVNDEAKKHNENLPGMGGVFNTVNLHVYHYAGNNPVKYTDPDGNFIASYFANTKFNDAFNFFIEKYQKKLDTINRASQLYQQIYDLPKNTALEDAIVFDKEQANDYILITAGAYAEQMGYEKKSEEYNNYVKQETKLYSKLQDLENKNILMVLIKMDLSIRY